MFGVATMLVLHIGRPQMFTEMFSLRTGPRLRRELGALAGGVGAHLRCLTQNCMNPILRDMKIQMCLRSLSLVILGTALLVCSVGCETGKSRSPGRTPTTEIDVYRDGQKPQKNYKELKLLTDDGRVEEQQGIEGRMIKKAKAMGGNAIIFHPLIESGGEGQPFGGWKKTYFFKASVVVYE
jgi:hypothetical protein